MDYILLKYLKHSPSRNYVSPSLDLGRCTALSSGTECERYWEARTKMMEN